MQPVQPNKRKHPPTPIGKVLNKYAISLRDLEKCLEDEGVAVNSRSTLHRMVHGKLSDSLREQLHPAAARCLSKFLVARKLDKAEIDAELSAVFTEGEYQPMISKRVKLSLDECRYFGLVDKEKRPVDPFSGDPQSKDEMFISPAIREIFDRIIEAIKYRHFIAILGPIGSGKTTLRALIEDHLAEHDDMQVVWPEFFAQRKVTEFEVARAILTTFGMTPPGRSGALAAAVKNRLAAMTRNGKRVSLGFDEGHKLNKELLKSLKNFHEMSSGGFQKYLGIFVFGWPIFEDTLALPEFQEIFERMDVIHMPNFRDHARDYIDHRLGLIGRKAEDLYDDEALDLICSQSETPLACGNIAAQALRVMKNKFGEAKVVGAAIKTEMFFQNNTREPGFRKR